MKLMVDMNLSPRWVPFLLDAGHKAVHWSTVGRADATDSEIMVFAAANDYVVLTNDLDFAAILASTHHTKPSVVQIRTEDLDPNVIGTQIVAALQRAQKELEAGALLTSSVTLLLLLVLFWRHNQSTHKRRYSQWEHLFLCQHCGTLAEQK